MDDATQDRRIVALEAAIALRVCGGRPGDVLRTAAALLAWVEERPGEADARAAALGPAIALTEGPGGADLAALLFLGQRFADWLCGAEETQHD